MLDIRCDKCGSTLQQPGALVFSPPTSEAWLVEKYHLCPACWPEVAVLLKNAKSTEAPKNPQPPLRTGRYSNQ
jgi:hypothetical protein